MKNLHKKNYRISSIAELKPYMHKLHNIKSFKNIFQSVQKTEKKLEALVDETKKFRDICKRFVLVEGISYRIVPLGLKQYDNQKIHIPVLSWFDVKKKVNITWIGQLFPIN